MPATTLESKVLADWWARERFTTEQIADSLQRHVWEKMRQAKNEGRAEGRDQNRVRR